MGGIGKVTPPLTLSSRLRYVCTYPGGLAKIFCSNVVTYKVGTYIISDSVERQSRDEKKHIFTKDVVGLLLGEVVSTRKNPSLQRMWLACF